MTFRILKGSNFEFVIALNYPSNETPRMAMPETGFCVNWIFAEVFVRGVLSTVKVAK